MTTRRAALTGAAALALAGPHGARAASAAPRAAETERLHRVLDDAYREAADAARPARDGWPDPSPAAAEARLVRARALVRGLPARFRFDALDAQGRLSWRLAEEAAARAAMIAPYRGLELIFEPMAGAQAALPAALIQRQEIASAADAEVYVRKLAALGPHLEALRAIAQARADAGVIPHAAALARTIEQARAVVRGAPFDGPGDSPLLADVTAKLAALPLTARARRQIARQAAQALARTVGPAYRALVATLESWRPAAGAAPGVWRFPDGDAAYRALLAWHTTTGLTPEAIHALGLQETARLQAAMTARARAAGFSSDFAALSAHLRADPRFLYPATDDGRAQCLSDIRAALSAMEARLPQAFARPPRAPVEVRRIEPFREATAGRAFYQSGGDGRPGVVFVNLSNMAETPRYQVEALAYHEGLPGHHLQFALHDEIAGLPTHRRRANFTAYVEGWALYAEGLAGELGGYRDPWADVGRLALELRRAGRLVVDTGLHWKRWDRQTGIDWIVANTPDPPDDAARQVDRYGVTPGQACAYTIGLLRVRAMRARAEAALGPRFDLRAFHAALLGDGQLPLDLWEMRMAEWTSLQRAA